MSNPYGNNDHHTPVQCVTSCPISCVYFPTAVLAFLPFTIFYFALSVVAVVAQLMTQALIAVTIHYLIYRSSNVYIHPIAKYLHCWQYICYYC